VVDGDQGAGDRAGGQGPGDLGQPPLGLVGSRAGHPTSEIYEVPIEVR
jgi:hypothetical protein